jgi:hypothetical protein
LFEINISSHGKKVIRVLVCISREAEMLFDPNATSKAAKDIMASTIAHEISVSPLSK